MSIKDALPYNSDFADQFTQNLRIRLQPDVQTKREKALLDTFLRAAHDQLKAGIQPAGDAAGKLPIAEMRAADVVTKGLVEMSVPTLYRALKDGRFYSVEASDGTDNAKLIPIWQFIKPVPRFLRQVLAVLRAKQYSDRELHNYLTGEVEELEGLSPAEVLAGKLFETQDDADEDQMDLLQLPDQVRLDKVLALARAPQPWETIG